MTILSKISPLINRCADLSKCNAKIYILSVKELTVEVEIEDSGTPGTKDYGRFLVPLSFTFEVSLYS